MTIILPKRNISKIQSTIANDYLGLVCHNTPISTYFITNSPIGKLPFKWLRTWDSSDGWHWTSMQPYYKPSSSFVCTGYDPAANKLFFTSHTGTITQNDLVYGANINWDSTLTNPANNDLTTTVSSVGANYITLTTAITGDPTGFTFSTALKSSGNINDGSAYFWGKTDVLVNYAIANNLNVMFTLGIFATWCSSGRNFSSPYGKWVGSPPTNYQYFANFLAALCNRYYTLFLNAGLKIAFEISNEPDFSVIAGSGNSSFWLGTASELADLVRVAKIVTQSISTNIQIVSPPGFISTSTLDGNLATSGLANILFANCGGTGLGANFVVDGTKFTHTLPVSTDNGGGKKCIDYCDVVSFHSYYYPVRSLDYTQYSKSYDYSINYELAKLVESIKKGITNYSPNKYIPLWMTEGGFPLVNFGTENTFSPLGWNSNNPKQLIIDVPNGLIPGVKIYGNNVPNNTIVEAIESTPITLNMVGTWSNVSPRVINIANTTGLYPGMSINGPLIPANSIIISIVANTSITLSKPLISTIDANINVSDGHFVVGATYTIKALGNTNWTAIGAGVSPIVGTTFVATGTGSLSGTGNANQIYQISGWSSTLTGAVLNISHTENLTTSTLIPTGYSVSPNATIKSILANTSITIDPSYWQNMGLLMLTTCSNYTVFLNQALTGSPISSNFITSSSATGVSTLQTNSDTSRILPGQKVIVADINDQVIVADKSNTTVYLSSNVTVPNTTTVTLSDVFYFAFSPDQLVNYIARTIIFQLCIGCDKIFYYAWDQIQFGLEQFVNGPIILDGNFLNYQYSYYRILSLGNTNWQAVGAPAGATVGTVFKATTKGTLGGTGTAINVSLDETVTSSVITRVSAILSSVIGKTVIDVSNNNAGGLVSNQVTFTFTDGTNLVI